MQETVKSGPEINFQSVSDLNFLYVEKVASAKKIKNFDKYELCIFKTDFSKQDLKTIKKIVDSAVGPEFWISSNDNTRKNILLANEIGIKHIIPYPFDAELIKKFFSKNDIEILKKDIIQQPEYPSLKGLKVMIVDDNQMNVELLNDVLFQFELTISNFTKPLEAIKVAESEYFDLLLLDVMMPEMSGFEFAKLVKEFPHLKNTPIIFVSALSDTQNKIRGYNLGSYAYIEKPFDVNLVRLQIFNILKTKKAQDVLSNTKETFFATVAHDLKTPIRSKINALNLLLNKDLGQLEDVQEELVEDILNSAKFMQDMVENLLCKNKMDCEEIALYKQICCIKDLINHCVELTKYILSAKNQRITVKCKIKNTLIPIDFLEMKRVFHNLIANASDYSPHDGEIIVEIASQDDKIFVSVQDYGKGINLENQEDVFEKYMSFAKENKTVGTGLGLYIAKRIVEAHRGEILLDSKIGYGTKITVVLPIYTKV